MSDAPERIWAFTYRRHDNGDLVIKTSDDQMTPEDIEYIRLFAPIVSCAWGDMRRTSVGQV